MGTLEMKVAQLTMDPITNMPVLVLRDERGGAELLMWIGLVEAAAIASELEKIPLQRPMAHDLMKTLLTECGARLLRVEIRDLRETTFYASLCIERTPGQPPVEVDARASDAIALAMRTGAPIHVARKVLRRSRRGESQKAMELVDRRDRPNLPNAIEACGGEAVDPALSRDLLESLADEDFGKWKM